MLYSVNILNETRQIISDPILLEIENPKSIKEFIAYIFDFCDTAEYTFKSFEFVPFSLWEGIKEFDRRILLVTSAHKFKISFRIIRTVKPLEKYLTHSNSEVREITEQILKSED